MVVDTQILINLSAQELREMVHGLLTKIAGHDQEIASRELTIAAKDRDILYRQAKIDKLTHELVTLKRWKFGRSSEQLNGKQISLIEETMRLTLQPLSKNSKSWHLLQKLRPKPRQQPKRTALPAGLPRVTVHHEPDATTCGCGCQLKRIDQDVSEKLDCTPGVFTVEEHVRGKWACAQCQTVTQAPVPA